MLSKICYQNVQGLIPIRDLILKQPPLNGTKIYEPNAYISINRDDVTHVIMLNETSLKNELMKICLKFGRFCPRAAQLRNWEILCPNSGCSSKHKEISYSLK